MIKVLKFGGSSVGSVENLNTIKDIVASDDDRKIVVCSAMSGVTDQLYTIVENIRVNNRQAIAKNLDLLRSKHLDFIDELMGHSARSRTLKQKISKMICSLYKLTKSGYSETNNSIIITSGEVLLTTIFSEFLRSEGVWNEWLDAKDFMYVEDVDYPNIEKVAKRLKLLLANTRNAKMYITQGFVCRKNNGKISHLERGGSDYTATIIGAALNVEEVQIWTDISGLHNNDPRYVSETYSIPHITYSEAADLAYFGAKILHPKTVYPVINKEIPIILKNTFDPTAEGTVISNRPGTKGIKAIAAKDGITLLKIKSNGKLNPHKYLKRIFELLDKYDTSVDMMTASEVAISITIDKEENLQEIVKELGEYSKVSIESDYSIICIVGDNIMEDKSTKKVFDIINQIPVKMVSYGSLNNIPVLVETASKIQVLQLLNRQLFPVAYDVV